MTAEAIGEIVAKGMLTVLYIVGPPLAAAMAVGLLVAVIQAATQIQETSLTFVPKIAAIGLTTLATGSWSISHLVGFVHEVMEKVSQVAP